MPLFEEPLAGHLAGEPILIHDIALTPPVGISPAKAYVIYNDQNGAIGLVAYDVPDLTVDWRWLPKDDRWYDLVSIHGLEQREPEPEGVDEAG